MNLFSRLNDATVFAQSEGLQYVCGYNEMGVRLRYYATNDPQTLIYWNRDTDITPTPTDNSLLNVFQLLSKHYGACAATTYTWLREHHSVPAAIALKTMHRQIASVGSDPTDTQRLRIVTLYRNPDCFPFGDRNQ